ncbi:MULTISPECIES: MBL fold metallo-hydrolase [unclassified Janthinobacterium]|uniref:MBL fold metallo-hydrolase n=1 Tax=unclassified Janthinobacterium TaxID=2610881 RepID=UPI001610D685|nr:MULTISPECIES: MBL fold metallo-hydrolase [unclassified Janthinobacterium]MBB5367269.1 phosphoribosyl 1,2-cyclic phosphodiesterase [Janthinobacterium sp. K2C7]MBB5380253.1 phosphoribosyl 1,2-cyclic phosphodiesterase [Janthinobacterium sp. K2Li3]MBB5385651.1 phosphoribosyl 1,2-cyclic phosphodiesterase [Janthinobacterium sp. K2E3]
MKFTFRGVRGSIPSPGPLTARYGGNTTCIEVRSDDDDLIILDAGSGIFSLAQQLPAGQRVDAHIFITHSHWDHIHGLPMFTPLFVAGNRVRLHGALDTVSGRGIEHVMAVQLQSSYFPVSEAAMAASIEYRTIAEHDTVMVGQARVRGVQMNHPVVNLGYRIDCAGVSLFFSGDHEPFYNPYPPGHVDHAVCASHNATRQARIETMVAGVDALIMDCSYTREEYPDKQGWGHGTFDAAFELALRCGARRLYCTHHEPTRSDDQLEAVFADVQARYQDRVNGLQVFLAYEGLTVALA